DMRLSLSLLLEQHHLAKRSQRLLDHRRTLELACHERVIMTLRSCRQARPNGRAVESREAEPAASTEMCGSQGAPDHRVATGGLCSSRSTPKHDIGCDLTRRRR